MADNWTFKDSAGSTQTNSAKDEGGGVFSTRMTPRVAGADVDSSNPFPITEPGGHLASLDTKTPALGQALAAASSPVVLTAAQLTTLTPPAALTNYAAETGGNLAGVNTHAASIDTKTPALGQALAAASVPIVLTAAQITTLTPLATVGVSAGTAHVGEVSGNTTQVLVTVTRPADTNAYAALDSVNTSTSAPTIITFAGAGRANGVSGYVVKAKLQTDQSTCVASFRLHLFNVNNPTLPNDNAAYAEKWADRAGYLGAIDFAACLTEGTGSDSARALATSLPLAFKCASADTNLYGLLETLTVFTPANAQNIHLELMCESN